MTPKPDYRYDIRKVGSDTWEVYDICTEQVAALHGIALKALTLEIAADSARLLNRGYILSLKR
ncbi:hypothetical protein [Pseudorhizobium flavum]|uniref:hypothetical protein n=1 Tax=Pseudorhizobium flavum TaxID=1335061 RepID=UPI002491C830|nr:hypothetical protein [Pseudorhizobium flavum]